MQELINLNSKRVFDYFLEMSKIPHGSGNMEKISNYCVEFAKSHSLRYFIDDAKNVIIYKNATAGYEDSAPVILQGHLDMVCQKTPDYDIDFLNDSLKVYLDGEYLKAENTTLGADNGIAGAMIFAILENDEIHHPEIQAVFTTDEEIGMVGAAAMDMSKLTAKQMINLDSEDEGVVTVSCAGGADFKTVLSVKRENISGTALKITLFGLLGGHSGVDINKHRVNADILTGRILNKMSTEFDFKLISVNGGDKSNAIANRCEIELVVNDTDEFIKAFNSYAEIIKNEIGFYEKGFKWDITALKTGEFAVMDSISQNKVIFMLCCLPNGILEMSAEIENLVETSLNLGILKTENKSVIIQQALRSNKESALNALISKMECFAKSIGAFYETSGFYPPWEYRSASHLRELYTDVYKKVFGIDSKSEAIHAGLECAMFASRIKDIDCIAIGPTLLDVHTVNERANIYSIDRTYTLLLEILRGLK